MRRCDVVDSRGGRRVHEWSRGATDLRVADGGGGARRLWRYGGESAWLAGGWGRTAALELGFVTHAALEVELGLGFRASAARRASHLDAARGVQHVPGEKDDASEEGQWHGNEWAQVGIGRQSRRRDGGKRRELALVVVDPPERPLDDVDRPEGDAKGEPDKGFEVAHGVTPL